MRQPGREGVYAYETGCIARLEPGYLVIATGTTFYIYSRETVRQVRLDSLHPEADHELASRYWNREKGWLITSMHQAPVVGGLLAAPLDSAPPWAATLVGALVLVVLVSYAAYRGYGTLVVARHVQELNRRKLQMEVKKLRYELQSLRQTLGLEDAEEAEAALDSDVPTPGLRIPEIDVLGYLRQKLGSASTEQAKLERRARWRRVWEAHRTEATWLQQTRYYLRELVNIAGALLSLLFGLGFAVDVVLPFVDPEFGGGGGIVMSAVFAGLTLLCLRGFLHFRREGEAITLSHREFKEAATRPSGA